MTLRLWFFGSGAIAVPTLEALARSHTVVGVVTPPDRPQGRGPRRPAPTPIKQAGRSLNLFIREPHSAHDPRLAEELARSRPDLLVVMAFGGLLPTTVLEIPRLGAVNVHPSLLPKYRGAAPIPRAILNGEQDTGITVFQMDAQLDHGAILVQERVPIGPGDTTAALTERLSRLAPAVLLRALDDLAHGRARATPQDDRQATTAPRFTKADGWIDWGQPAEAIARRVRALDPWPGTMTSWHGYALKLLRVAAVPAPAAPPGVTHGEILQVGPEGIVVSTGEGGLTIQELQLAGGRPLDAATFLRGHPMRHGQRLGPDPDTVDVR